MAKEVHTDVDADRAKSCGKEKDEAFRGALGVVAANCLLLVSSHNKKCNEIAARKDSDKNVFY